MEWSGGAIGVLRSRGSLARLLTASAAVALGVVTTAARSVAQSPAQAPFVAQLNLTGPIGPAAAEYVADAASNAQKNGADAILLRLDTPGGLSLSMHDIVSTILASPIPVLCYVAPGGARAASAGTYILYACQISAMAPATHLGAATPVALSGGTAMPAQGSTSRDVRADGGAEGAATRTAARTVTPSVGGDAESNKVLNDAVAYIRSLAQLRGRNASWAEEAVRGAATLTAREAVQDNVVNFVAPDAASVLQQASGREVHVGERTITLSVAGQSIRAYAPSWRTNFLNTITDPTIAYVLLIAGLCGLIVEAFHPGTWVPGIAGVTCLLVSMYALQLLPVSYAGVALMAVGVGLLITEMIVPTIGVVGVGGVISFVLGSVMLMNTSVPGYTIGLGAITAVAVAAVAVLVMVLWLIARARRARRFRTDGQLIGESGALLEPTNAQGEGWAQIAGERWRILADAPLPAGAGIRVVRREGLVLWVIPS